MSDGEIPPRTRHSLTGRDFVIVDPDHTVTAAYSAGLAVVGAFCIADVNTCEEAREALAHNGALLVFLGPGLPAASAANCAACLKRFCADITIVRLVSAEEDLTTDGGFDVELPVHAAANEVADAIRALELRSR